MTLGGTASSGGMQQEDSDRAPDEVRGKIGIVYERRRRGETEAHRESVSSREPQPRVSFVVSKRISWNRDLSTRGRESIVLGPGADFRLPLKPRIPQKNSKHPPIKRRSAKQNRDRPDFLKEKAYFKEVDEFELVEESPSPKKMVTWELGIQNNLNGSCLELDLPAVLERWKISKLASNCRNSGHLFKIMETPLPPPSASTCSEISTASTQKQTEKTPESCDNTRKSFLIRSFDALRITDEPTLDESEIPSENLTEAERKSHISLSLTGELKNPFEQLLMVCKQSTALTLSEVISQYCDPDNLRKIGEGTYGEAFKAGSAVCKIVPIDGDLLINGEVQKRSEEVLEEVLLSLTLNSLRENDDMDRENACSIFIETKDLRVCEGLYGSSLVKAWENWDAKHGSENDHPKDFPVSQRYIVFVLADGGRDLENFVLDNFDEARSLLIQVTAGLAVAEIACEFEHRDLHWGNILLSRKETHFSDFNIKGRKMRVKTNGLEVAIIDFTLSRINTGEAILFLDLSTDPALFEGPKGDKQAETYRKMREVTEDSWEGSFPKTNVLWLQYLVDVLLLKKTFRRTAKDERDLRSLKKRLSSYDSAASSLSDEFFTDLLEER